MKIKITFYLFIVMCGVMISHHRMVDKNLRLKLQLHKVTHISNLEVSILAINV